MKEQAVKALKRAVRGVASIPKRTFEHYKGKIQRVNQLRREKDQQMQWEHDISRGKYKEKDPNYITVPPSRRHDVMSTGRRIVK